MKVALAGAGAGGAGAGGADEGVAGAGADDAGAGGVACFMIEPCRFLLTSERAVLASGCSEG